MGKMIDIINIILLIAVVFIFIALRSVLGRRTGLEKPVIFDIEEVVESAVEYDKKRDIVDSIEATDLQNKFDKELKTLVKNDKQFTVDYFSEGVKKAYELILVAYAEENLKLLDSLLTQNIYEEFNHSIKARKDKQQTLEYILIKVENLEIQDISITKNIAKIKVSIHTMNNTFVSEIINDEKVNKHNTANIKEIWTFDKNLKSSDPNWKVSEINRPN